MWFTPRALTVAGLIATLVACADQPTEPSTRPEEPRPAPVPVGVYEISMAGLDGSSPDIRLSKAVALPPSGATQSMSSVPTGVTLELVSSSTFTEGTRGQDGHRYASFTFRVKNASGAPLNNLTLIPITTAATIAGSPFSTLLLFNNTPASAAVATAMVPTGAVFIGEDTRMHAKYPDALQVFTEAEVAAIPLPAGVTGIFPYGFVVGNPSSAVSRTLPNAADANDFGGVVTLSFRYPLQATVNADPFFLSVQVLAVQDTETRMTESIEERQDTAGVRRARERATALGATTVTVLGGSAAADPFVTDYPGQRQICSFRTAGTAASPVTNNRAPAGYTHLEVYRPSQAHDPCAAYYAVGTPPPANYGMSYTLTLRAMDHYGNVKTAAVDTVSLTSTDGTATMPPPGALVSGVRNRNVTYTTYGNSTITAIGRRLRGQTPLFMNGMTRWWDGDSDTQWLTNLNWHNDFHPGAQDSVIIHGDSATIFPLLIANTAVPNIIMMDGTSTQPFVNLASFDFTITGSLAMGNNGTFTGTGRVILAGTSGTFGGGLSNVNFRNLRVTGSYSATSNANVTGGRIVVQGGRLRSQGYRIRVRPS